MLITTDLETPPLDLWHMVRSWPGPHCLCLLSPAQPPQPWIDAAQAHFFIFDYATPKAPPMIVLRDIVLRSAAYATTRPQGPLLFTHGPITSDALRSAQRLVRSNAFAMDRHLDPATGALQSLVLGHKIVESPLFRTFFAGMSADLQNTETERSLNVLKEHLIPHD